MDLNMIVVLGPPHATVIPTQIRVVVLAGSNLVQSFPDLLLSQLLVDHLAAGFVPEGQ